MSGNWSEGPAGSLSSDHGAFLLNPVALPDPLRYIYIIYLLLILFIGVPGNILIALVYGRTQTKNTCDWFILFMSVTDCTVCLLSPLLHLRYELQINVPWMSGTLCGMEHWLQLTAMLSSCHYLTAIALDRYVKICNSRLPTLTPKIAPYACLLSFISSAVICMYPSLDSFHSDACGMFDPRGFETSRKVYFTLIFCGFVVCFILVTFAYWNVCKQIFIKVKTKRRLYENNGLHGASQKKHVEEPEEPDQSEFRVNSCNWFISRLFKTVRVVCCCQRHDPNAYSKSSELTEGGDGTPLSEQFPLTNTNCLKRSNLSLDSDNASTDKDQKVPVKTSKLSDDNLLLYDVRNGSDRNNENAASSGRHEVFQLEKEIYDKPTSFTSADCSSSVPQNSLDVGDTKLTLLSLTKASWPSTEEEPTPSAEMPVSFYLENLVSQGENVELRIQDNKTSEQNSTMKTQDLKKTSIPNNEDVHEKDHLIKKSIDFDAMSQSMRSNVFVNKLSLLEESEPHSILPKNNLKHALVECSVTAGGTEFVQTSLLTHSKSQPLMWSYESGPVTNTLGIPAVSKSHGTDSSFLNNSRLSNSTEYDSSTAANTQASPHQFLRSRSAGGNINSWLCERFNSLRPSGCIKNNIPPQTSGFAQVRSCNNDTPDAYVGGTVNLEVTKQTDQEDDQQLRLNKKVSSVSKIKTISETVDTTDPKSDIATSPGNVTNLLDSRHSRLVSGDSNFRSNKSLCQTPTPSPSVKASFGKKLLGSHGKTLTVATRAHHPSLKSMNSNSIDSVTGVYTRDDDEIEEDLPTASFMNRWRSQVRRKAKTRRNKGLTSSGKSMCSSTGKRFARERQVRQWLDVVILILMV